MPDSSQELLDPGSELATPEGAVDDSLSVAIWTIVSRLTGVLRGITIAAVLGVTYFANTYQFTNSLPNLIFYGLLAGSLFSSLLVPALVGHVDSGDWARSAPLTPRPRTARCTPVPCWCCCCCRRCRCMPSWALPPP